MRKLVLYFILFFQILLIISLVKGVYDTFRSRERIVQLQDRKAALEAKKQELETRMAEVQSPLYLERVARDELHLSKPGETVVIVPMYQQTNVAMNLEKREDTEKPNWYKWWVILSGRQ